MRRPVLFALFLMLTGVAGAQQSPPPAFVHKVALSISSQPFVDALSELGRQTGLAIAVYSSVGRGITAPKLKGEYTPAEALDRILVAPRLSPKIAQSSVGDAVLARYGPPLPGSETPLPTGAATSSINLI